MHNETWNQPKDVLAEPKLVPGWVLSRRSMATFWSRAPWVPIMPENLRDGNAPTLAHYQGPYLASALGWKKKNATLKESLWVLVTKLKI